MSEVKIQLPGMYILTIMSLLCSMLKLLGQALAILVSCLLNDLCYQPFAKYDKTQLPYRVLRI